MHTTSPSASTLWQDPMAFSVEDRAHPIAQRVRRHRREIVKHLTRRLPLLPRERRDAGADADERASLREHVAQPIRRCFGVLNVVVSEGRLQEGVDLLLLNL